MNLVSFNDPQIAGKLLDGIRRAASGTGTIKIMEVCGTHTMEIGRLGLRSLLPENVELVSGPGCPVCVTPGGVIDTAAELALGSGVVVSTFGDMVRVPGTRTSLEKTRTNGGAIQIVTSPLQAVANAESNPQKEFVFIAVGFETTVPVVARAVTMTCEKNLENMSFIICHRLVPPALDTLIADRDIGISAFLLPGHVSAIIGTGPYAFLDKEGVPAAITGFESLDIVGGIHAVVTMLAGRHSGVVNRYPRVVKDSGNSHAMKLIDTVFRPVDAVFRGIGTIPQSGLALREKFARVDACRKYGIKIREHAMPQGCACGAVLKGKIIPDKCPLFATSCTPDTPVGPCMVSSEGSCAAYYRYER
ncbi:MAG: hydrogenase formation protein HypD [Chitinivibrionales bacterium]|nr:hydrogenase formation protein HypD [Chitinivibrionales bacterium]